MSRWVGDRSLIACLRLAAATTGSVVLLIFVFLVFESWSALEALGLRFVTDSSWHPASDPSEGTFNLTPMLVGTLAATAGSMLLATPLALASAVFCNFYAAPRPAQLYRRMIELLAGIPSVVYGFWGLVVLVPLIRQIEPPGASLLAGILVLTIMILPTIALTADSAFGAVPESYLQASAALGLSRTTTLAAVVVPAARSGLFTGAMLGTGRALGETMAVLMVCGNVVQAPASLFDPIRTLTANIALEMAYALGDHRSALFVTGLALMCIVAALVLLTETAAERWTVEGP
ncbi:MAG: phosphate ABC transporter permease subunit PstC [Acidobacteriota bacterium]